MKNKLIGIITLTSILLFILLAVLVMMEGEFFSASNFQLLLVFFTLSIVTTGWYSIKNTVINPIARFGIPLYGFALVLFSALVSFNILPFLSGYNWLISAGILYLLLVQLQLLHWGQKPGTLTKVASFILIGCNAFLGVFFIAKWHYSAFRILIDTVIIIAIIVFILGLAAVKKQADSNTATPVH